MFLPGIWLPNKRKILNAMGVFSAVSIAFGIFLLFLLFSDVSGNIYSFSEDSS
ncbi:hypothetical protein BAXH7_01940 [Bacillus amyloliquefaciens XH7]|nr:hypothetical protein LL3_01682 [Bacillus amyloliquefaciens LL3]AEK89072.1 hypothetical protein BAXH7_01940 [Bacillus amyloliquefaciens XH7]KYC94652.1 hypothetical protein B425_1566 [Bacillus amyloliquefaciens]